MNKRTDSKGNGTGQKQKIPFIDYAHFTSIITTIQIHQGNQAKSKQSKRKHYSVIEMVYPLIPKTIAI